MKTTKPSTTRNINHEASAHQHAHLLHEWRNKLNSIRHRHEWENASWRTKLWWFRQAAYRMLTAQPLREKIPAAWSNIQAYGPTIRDTYDTSLLQQFLQQCYIALRHDISPSKYYTYRLYYSNRWEASDTFLYDAWEYHANLLYELNTRSRPAVERATIANKKHFFEHCQSHGLPTVPIYAIAENGSVAFPYSADRGLPNEDLFIKPAEGKKGHGVRQYAYDAGIWMRKGQTYNQPDLVKELERLSTENNESLIVQPRLTNHSAWQPFTSGALATIRIITGRRPCGNVKSIGAVLRMPTGKSVVDNAHAGSIRAQISLHSGRLSKATSYLQHNGTRDFCRHPDTSDRIEGGVVPEWSQVFQLAEAAHQTFDTVFIGWDVALTIKGPMLIEANNLWSSATLEIPHLRLDRYAKVYDEWMHHLIG